MQWMANLIYFIIRVVGRLPLSVRSQCGEAIGASIGRFFRRERTIAELQLRKFAGVKHESAVALRVFGNLGATLMESFSLHRDVRNPHLVIECDDQGIIAQVAAQKGPVLALTGHVGNWELCAAFICSRGIPLVSIARPARSRLLQMVLERIRDGYGLNVIWRGGRSTLKTVVRELENNRVVAALLDQDIAGASELVPFFGYPVRVPTSVIEAGKKCGAEFVSAFSVRVAPGRFRFSVRRIPGSLSAAEIVKRYHEHLESQVRDFPEQWVWFHKRWRTLPEGQRMSSAEYRSWLENLREPDCAAS